MIKNKFGQIRPNLIGSMNNNKKANSLISIFMKNNKKLPLISINSENNNENNKLKDFKESKESNINNNIDKKSNIILKQKSLNQNYVKSKFSSPNVFNKKKSDNIFKDRNYNNIFLLKNNFIKNLPQLKKEEISNSQKEYLFSNNSNYHDLNFDSDIYQFSSVIPTSTTKKDEFEISEEDKMFDQFTLKKKKKIKKIKIKPKHKIKKKKKLNFYNSYEAPLNKVYKKIPQIINKIELTKKLKNSFSLLKYQNLLLDVGSKTLGFNSRAKLTNEFTNLRNISNKKYELLRKSVRDIENKEKEIIDRVNKQQDRFKKNMRENNYYCMTIGMNFHSIPSLKFHRTLPSFKCKKKGM